MASSVLSELAIVDEMVRQLPAYLESGAVFRPVVVPGQATSTLTLGTLQDHVAALEAMRPNMSAAEAAQFDQLKHAIGVVRSQHGPSYGAKLLREVKSQLDSWRYALDDILRGDAGPGDYARDVLRRARIEDTLTEAAAAGAEVGEYRRLVDTQDARLRTRFEPGAYVGPAGREGRYPADRFWFLYGRPKRSEPRATN